MDIKTLATKFKLAGLNVKILDIQTLISISDEGQRLYHIDSNNQKVKSNMYESLIPYPNIGLVICKLDSGFGILRLNGIELVKPLYKNISFVDNKLIIIEDESSVAIYTISFNQITPMIYRKIRFIFKLNTNKYLVGFLTREYDDIYYILGDFYSQIYDIPFKIDYQKSSKDILIDTKHTQIYNLTTKEIGIISDLVTATGYTSVWIEEDSLVRECKLIPAKNLYTGGI